MEVCPDNSFVFYPWQATISGILRDLKDEFELAKNTSALFHQPMRKKLTTEALFMLLVILLFVILNLIRTAATVYESYRAIGKETPPLIIARKEKARDGGTNAEEEKKSFETSSNAVFLTNVKRFLDCFCIKSNLRRIFSMVSTEKQLCCLHGIRGIIVVWVIFGHMTLFYIRAVRTPEKLRSLMELQASHVLKNTVFIVEAFLVLSGFLNGYLFSQVYEKRKGKIPWLSFYVHRFVRIIPMYFLVLGFYSTLFTYLDSGLVWPTYDTNPVCRDNWMWNVLFLNNFISHKKLCLSSSWYLACEMQLYVISPIFLIVLMRRPKFGYILIALGISSSCFINFSLTKKYKLLDGPARVAEYAFTDPKDFQRRFFEYYDILYSKPYARLGTYLIGLALGCYLYQRKNSPIKKDNVIKLSLGWIMTAIFMWTSIFALHGREESILETAIYNGFKHVIFSFSIAWVIYVCVTGQGGFVNRFLSSKIFIVISRLSYTTYLTHLMLLKGYILSMTDQIDHSVLTAISYFPTMLWLLSAAFVVSLIFESPILRITALFFKETDKETKADKQE